MNDILIDKIKELSKKLADDNITFPVEMDYFLIEQAMLLGASIVLKLILKSEIKDNHVQLLQTKSL